MPTIDPDTLLERLVDTHWATAARHAWRQYQNRGRGAIVFTVEADAAEGERTPLRYLTFSDEEAAATGRFAKLHELVSAYDPRREAVMAAVLPDGRTVFDVYQHTPAPPDAS